MTTNTINPTNARIIKAITGRLSLRKPQEDSLIALDQAIESAPDTLEQSRDIDALLKTLSAEFPTLSDFEREFPSLCFALATGAAMVSLANV